MNHFEMIIISVVSRFNDVAVPYMIIGGQALLLYGEPRLTRNIDINAWCRIGSRREKNGCYQ